MYLSQKGLSAAHKSLLKALSAEQQAIAIYSAEIAVLKILGQSDKIFSQILSEEREHAGHITRYLKENSLSQSNAISTLGNRLAGHALGTVLALLPRKTRNKIHVWAENEAAKIYFSCAKTISHWQTIVPNSSELIQSLRHSADQEISHALRFKRID